VSVRRHAEKLMFSANFGLSGHDPLLWIEIYVIEPEKLLSQLFDAVPKGTMSAGRYWGCRFGLQIAQ
jgi:hypothetical protein